MTRNIKIKRESSEIFHVEGDFPYWAGGKPILERMAFNQDGNLSNVAAQSWDRRCGRRYILVSPFALFCTAVISAARVLSVGEYTTVTL